MKTRAPFGDGTPVDEVMRISPETICVFLDYRMRCVGCFHTIRQRWNITRMSSWDNG